MTSRQDQTSSQDAARASKLPTPSDKDAKIRTGQGPAPEGFGEASVSPAPAKIPVGAWALLEKWQFELNALASVAIEMPALRPAFERMRDALD